MWSVRVNAALEQVQDCPNAWRQIAAAHTANQGRPVRLFVASILDRNDFVGSPFAHGNSLAFVLELTVQPAACHAHERVEIEANLTRKLPPIHAIASSKQTPHAFVYLLLTHGTHLKSMPAVSRCPEHRTRRILSRLRRSRRANAQGVSCSCVVQTPTFSVQLEHSRLPSAFAKVRSL